MKHLKSIKKYLPIIFISIFIYQLILVIFTYTKDNINILWILVVIYAIYIIIGNNKNIIDKIKNKFKK